MKPSRHIHLATYLCYIACLALVAASHAGNLQNSERLPTLVFQETYDLQNGSRDIVYAGKLMPNTERFVLTGVTTTPPSAGPTGLDFFALSINSGTGQRDLSFGSNGLVVVDSGNVGGSSRTDVATDLVFLKDPQRVALLGEAVVSKSGPANLTFCIAMLNTSGSLDGSFANQGIGLYDIQTGANDEIFFGFTDEDTNDMLVGGFANPTTTVGAGPAFDCAVLKVDQYGNRVKTFGQNGQVIIDFNGWDERCRAGIRAKFRASTGHQCLSIVDFKARLECESRHAHNVIDTIVVGGRSKPAPRPNTTATQDESNFRATRTVMDFESGSFLPSYGDSIFGFGRRAINTNNGSFETIRIIQADDEGGVFLLGNWGGWDNGVSGNKAIGVIKVSRDGMDFGWGNEGIVAFLPPPTGGSYDVYSFDRYKNDIYIVGGVKPNASAASLPQGIIARLRLNGSRGRAAVDNSFGVNGVMAVPKPAGIESILLRSVEISGRFMYITASATIPPSAATNYDVMVLKYKLH